MDKGNGSRQTASSKSSGSENKNKSDGSLKYCRFPRYKEGASPRPDARRKSNPQKSRDGFDKRPRTRSGAFCERYRNEVAENLDVGVFPRQGSKKVNLNHLLNFTLASVDGRDSGIRSVPRNRPKLPKYNKELFLQANCQFVTQDDGNYTLHCQNPDVLVDWALIEEVRLPSYDLASCPICLYPPIAAKITHCGHIFCWSCILHYLALTDRSWQKCPICFEAVHKNDLKSVVPVTQKQISVGSELVMCLMKREKGSMIPVPINYPNVSVCKIDDDESITRFQKLLLASTDEVRKIIKRERMELDDQLFVERDAPERCFIESALKMLDEREKSLETSVPIVEKSYENNHFDDDTVNGNVHQNNISVPTENKLLKLPDTSIDDNEIEHIYPKKENDAYYFYQSQDGQHIYLHNLNVRMLVKEFGSLKDSPPVLKAKVFELENLSMSETLRKRLRYLQHIPLTCEFQVAELNFQSLISELTYQEFVGEVIKRQKCRNRKAREERRREKHIAEEENKKLGKFPGATYNINSIDQFPICRSRNDSESKDFNMSSSPTKNEYDMEYPSVGISNMPSEVNAVDSSSPPTTSFAQMLREGQTYFKQCPVSKPALKTVEQTKDFLVDDEEQQASVPEYHQSFSDAFQLALDLTINNSLSDTGGNSKKKKKEKGKILFSTSMCRNK